MIPAVLHRNAEAQFTATATVPTNLPAAPAAPDLFDFLGYQKVSAFSTKVKSELAEIPLLQLARTGLVNPTLGSLGLKASPGGGLVPPSLGGQPFGPPSSGGVGGGASSPPAPAGPAAAAPAAGGGGSPGGALAAPPPAAPALPPEAPDPKALAGAIASGESEAAIATEIAAIRFLGKQDCVCFPEVVDALLGKLDNCENELIRYEALRALRGCQGGGCQKCCRAVVVQSNVRQTCLCSTKVLKRLSDLLLERDVAGRIKERSYRVRILAKMIIRDCLASTPAPSTPQPKPDPPLPGSRG